MPSRKSKPNPITTAGGLVAGGGDGFEEAPQVFQTQSEDDARFDESVELMRSFSRIGSPEARRKVIQLARRLADDQDDGRI